MQKQDKADEILHNQILCVFLKIFPKVLFAWKFKNANSSVILKIFRIGSVVFSFSDIWEDVTFDTDELQRKSGETFLEQKYQIYLTYQVLQYF